MGGGSFGTTFVQEPLQATPQAAVGKRPAPSNAYPPGVSGNPRGHGLRKDRAREDEAARLDLVAAIVRDFGRRLTAAEAALVDEFAAASIRAKRLRQGGKPADDAVRLMARIGRMLGIRDGAAPAKPPSPSLGEYLTRRAGERARAPAVAPGPQTAPGPEIASAGAPGEVSA
jgi:hypothetical protein